MKINDIPLVDSACWLGGLGVLNYFYFSLLRFGMDDLAALSLTASGIGAMLSEMFLLAALLAFGPQRLLVRIYCSWGAGLFLFGCYAWGAVNFAQVEITEEALPSFKSGIGATYVCVLTAVVSAAIALLAVRYRGEVHLVYKRQEPHSTRPGRVQWSLLDLLAITLLTAISLAILRFVPIQFQTGEELWQLLIGILVTALLTPILAWISVALLILLLKIRSANQRGDITQSCGRGCS